MMKSTKDVKTMGDMFVRLISEKGETGFQYLCSELERENPPLLTKLLDSTQGICPIMPCPVMNPVRSPQSAVQLNLLQLKMTLNVTLTKTHSIINLLTFSISCIPSVYFGGDKTNLALSTDCNLFVEFLLAYGYFFIVLPVQVLYLTQYVAFKNNSNVKNIRLLAKPAYQGTGFMDAFHTS